VILFIAEGDESAVIRRRGELVVLLRMEGAGHWSAREAKDHSRASVGE
jgi:hypothetical protein